MNRLVILLLFSSVIFVASARASENESKIQAIAFDALALFDASPRAKEAAKQFPGRGKQLAEDWRIRLFEYQWLRAAGSHYADFEQVAADALGYAARKNQVALNPEQRESLLSTLHQLRAYDDVKPALEKLKSSGCRLLLLSNMTPAMLQAAIRNSHLDGMFDAVLSTDQIHTYKPDPKAYQLGVDSVRLPRDRILFIPSAGWDLAGARWFGYPVWWLNRAAVAAEELEASPEPAGTSMSDLVRFLASR